MLKPFRGGGGCTGPTAILSHARLVAAVLAAPGRWKRSLRSNS